MARKEKLFKSKERKSRSEVSDFLRKLADKIDSGSVSIMQGNQEVQLQIPNNLKLDVEAEQKDKGVKGLQQELEIELKWYEGDNGNGNGSLTLK